MTRRASLAKVANESGRAYSTRLATLARISDEWIDLSPPEIAQATCNVIVELLRADRVRVHLLNPATGRPVVSMFERGSTPGRRAIPAAPARRSAESKRKGDTLVRRQMDVPVGRGGALGHLVVRWVSIRSLTAFEARLLKIVATQASIALRHADLRADHADGERRHDRSIGIVSHELGNMLTTVHACASALLDPEPPSMNGIHSMALLILRSTTWMQQIIQDLLDHAKLDAGELTLSRQSIMVSDVIGAAQTMFAPLAHDRAIEFVVEMPGTLPPIDADSHRLLQVLSNLLSNALKFTEPGGRVVLTARPSVEEKPRPGIVFSVGDTGCGISPEDLAHVFDWFWQARRKDRAGAGLGLAISKGLIEAHGSHLQVESVLGSGTTFWFTIATA